MITCSSSMAALALRTDFGGCYVPKNHSDLLEQDRQAEIVPDFPGGCR